MHLHSSDNLCLPDSYEVPLCRSPLNSVCQRASRERRELEAQGQSDRLSIAVHTVLPAMWLDDLVLLEHRSFEVASKAIAFN